MKYDSILRRFPNLQLSYEKLIHKKVDSDYCQAIPYGKKYFAWFTFFNETSVCVLLEIHRKTQISKIINVVTCYHECLATNTIFYGTLVKNKYFFIEDIYYYKNKDVSNISGKEQLELLANIFKNEIKQINLTNNSVIFGLPLMGICYNTLLNEVHNLPYKIYCIQFRKFYGKYQKQNLLYNEKIENVVFSIKAEVTNDIYSLYCINKGKKEYYDVAYIPDYKTSVMMNSIFRNIKENINLDALEESDEEEEFENISENKFVDTEKEIAFICEYKSKFNKWVPISQTTASIIQRNQLYAFEKK